MALPVTVWEEPEVREALSALDFRSLCRALRRHSGLRQEDLARIAGEQQSYWSKLESGTVRLTELPRAIAFLEALGTPAELAPLPLRASPTRVPHTTDNSTDPHITGLRLATEAASSSLAFTEHAMLSNVDDDELEFLSMEIGRIATAYVHARLTPLFQDLVTVRDRIFGLIQGRQRPSQTRDLFMLAGTTCLLLAHASQNLGDERSALAQVRTAWACAGQADHTGLRAWTRGTYALIAEWSPRARMALKFAEEAAALAPAGESRIRIAAIEARTAARLGDRARALASLDRMYTAREESPVHDELTQFGGLLSFPAAKQKYYTGSVYSLLGDHARAEQLSGEAIREYAAGPPEERSYGDESLARVDIITARLAQGELAQAAELMEEIVSMPTGLRIRQLGNGLGRVEAMLRSPAIARNPATRELAELTRGYEVMAAHDPVRSP
ncbi:helix-turn-helix transcriptional regulator [Streptomyces olivoreticuli]|uniref:helix-turn-helix domain-containing protein n=1 Tax=Streptomyces olivoreticuli TaxID=68246 RepID=UPI00265A380D|nr:helix-turn-helix transcriptional regulator [Streptomyces olivoreticuli]WKK22181.1 helix-turn-helix transcriptional regulator [Streptomyces olivoreticuli]